MGVRSSVEVKSINSMQGRQKNQTGGNDIRKSAQATTMQSLIEQTGPNGENRGQFGMQLQ